MSPPMPIPDVAPALVPGTLDAPAARILANGTLTALVTAAGSGFVQSGWRRVTSGGADAVDAHDGILFYLRDEDDGRLWSAAHAPVAGAPDAVRVSARPGCLRIERDEHGIEASLDVALAPDAAADVRRLRLRNASPRARRISVTSCAGLVLHHPAAHASHPAFSKLFVQTRRDGDVLVARRRPRGAEPEPLCAAHQLAGPGALEIETDRARFLGRGRSLARPAALEPGAALGGGVGNVLDPLASQRRTVTLAPGETAEWIAVLAVGASEAQARDAA
ncbi:MAG: glycosyl transferase, partial [Proteobacteria bacterium]